jgi:hypothetical protein
LRSMRTHFRCSETSHTKLQKLCEKFYAKISSATTTSTVGEEWGDQLSWQTHSIKEIMSPTDFSNGCKVKHALSLTEKATDSVEVVLSDTGAGAVTFSNTVYNMATVIPIEYVKAIYVRSRWEKQSLKNVEVSHSDHITKC